MVPARRLARAAPGLAGLALGLITGMAAAADLPVVLRDQTGAVVRFEGARVPGAPLPNAFGGRTLRIHQTAERAVLEWESFDIRNPRDEVRFHQPASSSIALNRVKGAADVPSLINGRLSANGRVFLINHNGILFGAGAEVNVHSLVASALDIDDEIFRTVGFVNAINQPTAEAAFEAFGQPMEGVEIVVENGASISAAENGRVMLFAPSITNAGEISAPDGQVVLAAAKDKVYVAPAPRGSDVRGLLVEVATGGEVTNVGRLMAERGNVSVVGLAVNQEGVTRATTSVALNGTIMLKAQDMAGTPTFSGDAQSGRAPLATRGGELTLGAGSVTEVLPDGGGATALDAQRQPLSLVDLGGRQVRLEGGSRVTATGGRVAVEAAVNPLVSNVGRPGNPAVSTAEVRIEDGAVVDVSGDDTTRVPVTRNFVEVEARGNELADAPLQREGPIRGKTLTVDLRRGSSFLDTEGAVAGIQRGVGERLSAGGSVTIGSEGGVFIAPGATIDISGGQVSYEGAVVATSKLVTADGKVVDISVADPNRVYAGVLGELEIDHEKWGVTEVFGSAFGTFEPGYAEGRDAGRLALTAPGIELAGMLRAEATAGPFQRSAPRNLGGLAAFRRPFDQRPVGGSLEIDLFNRLLPDLFLGEEDAVPAANDHPAAGDAPLVISPDLLARSGLARVDAGNLGRVVVNRDIELAPWSTLSLSGSQVMVRGDITIPGGRIEITATNLLGEPGLADATALVAVDGVLDVSGRFTNDSPLVNRGRATAPIASDGGEISLASVRDVVLGGASVLDVGGGAHLSAAGAFEPGQGGVIDIETWSSADERFASLLVVGGALRGLGFEEGGSLSLTAEAVRVEGGLGAPFGTAPGPDGLRQVFLVNADVLAAGGFSSVELNAARSGLEVAAGTGVDLVAVNRVLDPTGLLAASGSGESPSSMAMGNGHPAERVADGTAIAAFSGAAVLPDNQRGPMDLALAAGPLGPLTVGRGARIRADPGAAITLTAEAGMTVAGTVSAPAGEITLTNTGGKGAPTGVARITLADGARLLAPGVAVLDPVNNLGRVTGEVLDGGRVSVRAEQGAVVAAPAVEINVDAATAELDIQGPGVVERRRVYGAAGEVELFAADSLLYQGSLSGRAAGTGRGGTLAVTLDPTPLNLLVLEPGSTSPVPLGPHVAVMDAYDGALPAAEGVLEGAVRNRAFVPVDEVVAGGFHSLAVTVRSAAFGADGDGVPVPDTPASLPVVRIPGETRLALDRSLVLDAAVIEAGGAGDVQLSAPYVALGSSDTRVRLDGSVPDVTADTNAQDNAEVLRLTPTPGDARLRVEGGLVELVGELITAGFGRVGDGQGVSLRADEAIRLRGVRPARKTGYRGVLRTAGDLALAAPRIHPATLTDFNLAVEGDGGLLTITTQAGQGTPRPPLSVGGRMTLTAARIRQDGNLFAPLGEIRLTAGQHLEVTAASLTSTSAAGVSAPFFRTQPGGDLLLPAAGGESNLVFVEEVENPGFERLLPEQAVSLEAPEVVVADGARFDLRGGSDVRAVEFVPGPGGSRDILLSDLDPAAGVAANPAFAILPGAGEYAPFDPLETPAAADVQGLKFGDTVILEEGTGDLAAGEYALLPPRYALFGGYLVTPVAGTTDLAVGSNTATADGRTILAGRLGVAGSDVRAARRQGFAIADGAAVRSRAEYLETPLAALYSGGSRRVPRDAGALVVAAETALDLGGRLVTGDAAGGRGATVDIVGDDIAIRSAANGQGGIELLTSQLEGLGAESLLIGGRRSLTPDGLLVTPVADTVTVAPGTRLSVPELVLTADTVTVGTPAGTGALTALASGAPATGSARELLVHGDAGAGINGDAALVAVSNRALTLERLAATGLATGRLTLEADVTLSAEGAIIADVAGDAVVAAALDSGGTVSLGASGISLGQTEGRAIGGGLILSNARLSELAGSDLTLRSDSVVSLFGALSDPVSGSDLRFERLAIDAAGLVGVDNAGAQARLVATDLALGNGSGEVLAAAGPEPAAGALELAADRVALGDGELRISGFGGVAVSGTRGILVGGDGRLLVESPLTVHSPVVAGAAGTSYRIDVGEHALAVTGADAAAALPAGAGLAAGITLAADTVMFGGRLALPSGRIAVTGAGDVRVAGGAVLDVAGRTLDFGPTTLGTPGGVLRLASAGGDVAVAPGAVLDVSPSPLEGEAGELVLEAPAGDVVVDGAAVLRSGPVGGTFTLDAQGLTVAGTGGGDAFTALNQLLGSDGFGAARSVRLRDQGITLAAGTTVRAHEVRAVSDTGDVVIAGTVDAGGQGLATVRRDGGTIVLAAGDSVELASTARLVATGTPAGDGAPAAGTRGGRVDLLALDGDGSDPTGLQDTVVLRSGAVIDVAGGADVEPGPEATVVPAPSRSGGRVAIHTRRLDGGGDGQTETLVTADLGATILGAAQSRLVATQVVGDGDRIGTMTFDGSLAAADITAIRNEIGAFMAAAEDEVSGLRVVPGLELRTSGDLVLQNPWDLYDGWHFGAAGDATGVLGLRAGGDVRLEADLSDAFFDKPSQFFGLIPARPDRLAAGVAGVDGEGNPVTLPPAAWSIGVSAGADLASADPEAVRAGTGDLVLADGARLRTGTGDLHAAAGGDILLEGGAAIYTGGYDRGLAQTVKEVWPGSGLFDTAFSFNQWLGNGAIFPTDGGRVRVRSGGDIVAEGAPALPTEWLVRIGEAEPAVSGLAAAAGAVPTHWGVAFQRFTGGIGALGGGALEVRAAGDVLDLAIAVPTSGRAVAGAVKDPAAPSKFGPATETTEVGGGGTLALWAGGDVAGGEVLLGDGAAHVAVGGGVIPGSGGSGLAIRTGGDSRLELAAAGGIELAALQDPTVTDLSASQGAILGSGVSNPVAYLDNRFFTYGEGAAVDLRSLAGDLNVPAGPGFATALPPVLGLVSASGDLTIAATGLQQFPSPQGQLSLLAGKDIRGAARTSLVQSDQDRALLPGIGLPTELGNVPQHALQPVHLGDPRPNLLVARGGSIAAVGEGFWSLQLAKATVLSAARDLRDLRVEVQNVHPHDVTAFVAGRDIVQSTQRDSLGNFQVFDAGSSFVPKYEISGPGAAQFVAGRTLSLGTSQGIETIGNTANSALREGGADLLLMAGLGGEPDYDGFITTVLGQGGTYGDDLRAFLTLIEGHAGRNDPVAALRSLDTRVRRQFLAGVLLAELKASGLEATQDGSEDYSRGFAAIEALFPGSDPGGGISMLLSQVQTLDGGDIEMLVPGGLINAGAANADIIRKGAAELGIVAATAGDIGVFVDDDFLVNSTRAFALQGDLLVWSSNGSIDAGKGAKTVSSVPNPITRIDQNGQTVIEFPPAVEGSGLQGVNAFLFAPRGVVNAGDAGIRATGDLTIGATEVLGADNIDVGGISVGVPTGGVAPPPVVPTQDNVATRATKEVTQQASAAGNEAQGAGSPTLSIISVEVLGFGGG